MLRRHPYYQCHPQGNGKNVSGSRIQKLYFGHTKMRYGLGWKEVFQETLSMAATDAPNPGGPGILSSYFPYIIKKSNDFRDVCLGVKGDLTVVAFFFKKKIICLFIWLRQLLDVAGGIFLCSLRTLVAACRLS